MQCMKRRTIGCKIFDHTVDVKAPGLAGNCDFFNGSSTRLTRKLDISLIHIDMWGRNSQRKV